MHGPTKLKFIQIVVKYNAKVYVKSALGPLADTCGKNIEPLGS